ncbi:39S ribosomal protein L12, mitochondrial [Oopsacas minuta]|uniref:39S ribosomal protein L12, mitochondrial n=1 Tax=Oopsacas minuta TaxID=111878 RepID=A0AAV7K1G0_9METZ|nr:39S ribosomal protein L12, mitochondrial [Oopsacas minuta]
MRSLHRTLQNYFKSSKSSLSYSYNYNTLSLPINKSLLNPSINSINIRFLSESADPIPLPTKDIPVKIQNIVQEIGALNLMEISQLNSHLKETLGLSDMPVMSMGGSIASQQEEEEKKPEQTEFTVKLIGFEVEKKIKLIKEVKSLLPDLNLVQAKKFVENPPGVIRKDIPREEAEKLMELLKSLGGKIELE